VCNMNVVAYVDSWLREWMLVEFVNVVFCPVNGRCSMLTMESY
jgi:hypothetical protein